MPQLLEKVEIWFKWEDDPQSAEVLLTSLSDFDKAQIAKAATTIRERYSKEHKKILREKLFDPMTDREESIVMAVKDWKNFFDADGKAMACTAQNKRLWACNDEFYLFFSEKYPLVEIEAKKRLDAKIKN